MKNNHNPCRRYPSVAIIILLLALVLAACDHLPFMPRLEIDKFPADTQLLETMEVRDVIYVRVENPARLSDPEAPETIWIPASVFKAGNYKAYTANLPQPKPVEVAANTPGNLKTPAPTSEKPPLQGEERLQESAPATDLTLRRRILLFPDRISHHAPAITTQLSVEMEEKLPLRFVTFQDPDLEQRGRLLSQKPEIMAAIRKWLARYEGPPPVQFVVFLTTSIGRDRQYFTCNWVDAQTGDRVAAFTFMRGLDGRLWYPLVPTDPEPLVNLVTATPWWCRLQRSPDNDKLYRLNAGHRSNLHYGLELMVYRQALKIMDPQGNRQLGFVFDQPAGRVSVVDFYGDDGAFAKARKPLPDDLQKGFAVEIPAPPQEEKLATSPARSPKAENTGKELQED
ncbi:MAG: hypothetical protein GXO34_06025 [Deltaproteobacteria bacterium]|nr:hypothetical protein [Deltaproteobacteria bacterium]